MPRVAVLDAMSRTDDHLSADDVRTAMSLDGVDLPRSSVVNILKSLSTAGLIRSVATLPGSVRYEASTEAHDHFHCVECGRITDVDAVEAPEPAVPGTVDRREITYLGRCHAHAADFS